MIRRIFAGMAFAFVCLVAGQTTAADLSLEDRAATARVEKYLNDISTLKADFVQISPDGTTASGKFYLERPGRLRFTYNPPEENFVVADGLFIYFWDSKLRQQTNSPIGATLADFILRKKIKLSDDVTVTKVEKANNALKVTLVQTKDPGMGGLTFTFAEKPFVLVSWTVLDASGQTTTVALSDVQTGLELDPDLFYFRAPEGADKK